MVWDLKLRVPQREGDCNSLPNMDRRVEIGGVT